MSKLLRYLAPGQWYFVTCVTSARHPVLVDSSELLLRALVRTKRKEQFDLISRVVLPDHFHANVHCPTGRIDKVMKRFKLSFSLQYRRKTGFAGTVWQHRYWDHIIRSEADLERHQNYILINPVKHGFVESAEDWPYSSFNREKSEDNNGLSSPTSTAKSDLDSFGE